MLFMTVYVTVVLGVESVFLFRYAITSILALLLGLG